MTLAVVALFAACESAEEQTPTNHLTITSNNTVEVAAEGETVAITYTINNPISGVDVATNIVEGKDAIEKITTPATGVILVDVKANTTTSKRLAIINVSYADESASVVINQAAGNGNGNENEGGNGNENDDVVTFEAAKFNGNYFGQKYGEGSDCYTIFLSDKGFNNANQAYYGGTYYYVHAFGPVAEGGAPYTLPNGTYKWDITNGGAPYTINSQNTQLLISSENEVETDSTYASNATMVVEDNKITLEMTLNGKMHKVVYTGEMVLTDVTKDDGEDDGNQNDPTDGQEKEAKTTLTDDLVFTFTDTPVVKWVYEGDWWKTGYSNYTIKLMNKPTETYTSHYLQLDIIADNTNRDGDFDGKYTIAYTPNKNVAVAGFLDAGGHTAGCWYCEYGGGSDVMGLRGYAMLIKGNVEITNNGNGTHTVKVDAYDCNNNHVTCDWTGEIVESNI